MSSKLIIGSIVYLNSGGPLMTVTSIKSKIDRDDYDDPVEYIQCQWFATEKLQVELFPIDCLKLYDGHTLF